MPYDPLPRNLISGMPVVVIRDASTELFRFLFSERDNQPRVSCRKVYHRLTDDENTRVEGGTVYPQIAGFWLRSVVEYQIWPEHYCKDTRGLQMTESEVGMIDWAAAQQSAGTHKLLFYPYSDLAGIGTDDPNFYVRVIQNAVIRTELAQDRMTGILEVESRVAITDWEKFLWVR